MDSLNAACAVKLAILPALECRTDADAAAHRGAMDSVIWSRRRRGASKTITIIVFFLIKIFDQVFYILYIFFGTVIKLAPPKKVYSIMCRVLCDSSSHNTCTEQRLQSIKIYLLKTPPPPLFSSFSRCWCLHLWWSWLQLVWKRIRQDQYRLIHPHPGQRMPSTLAMQSVLMLGWLNLKMQHTLST